MPVNSQATACNGPGNVLTLGANVPDAGAEAEGQADADQHEGTGFDSNLGQARTGGQGLHKVQIQSGAWVFAHGQKNDAAGQSRQYQCQYWGNPGRGVRTSASWFKSKHGGPPVLRCGARPSGVLCLRA